MECTESQLRFGTSLSAATDPSHAGHPLYDNQTKVTCAKEKRTTEEGSPFEKKGRLVVAKEREREREREKEKEKEKDRL